MKTLSSMQLTEVTRSGHAVPCPASASRSIWETGVRAVGSDDHRPECDARPCGAVCNLAGRGLSVPLARLEMPRMTLSRLPMRCPSLLIWLVLLSAAGCSRDVPSGAQPDDPGLLKPVRVQAVQAERVTLQPTLDLVGTIVPIPERTAVVSPQVAGWVQKLHVVEGQSVHTGDLLADLDARSARAAVRRAQAVVAEKGAAVRRLKRGYLPQEIAGARKDADQAAAVVDGLRNELTALKDLLDQGEMSPVTYETKANALKSAEAAFASAQQRIKLLEAGTRPEMIEEAEGQLAAANADLEQAQLNLAWCSITSPIDGVVVQLQARQGQFFDRAVPLATIMDLANVFVQLRIPGRDFGKVNQGTPVQLQLTSLPGRIFRGQVTRISGQADALTGNVVVFASVRNEDRVLRPGLSCQARIGLPEIANALVVPVAAVADHTGTSVVTVIRDGKAQEVKVETGIETHQQVEILKGLSAGDMVATVGGYGLPDGCPVKIVEQSKSTPDDGRETTTNHK